MVMAIHTNVQSFIPAYANLVKLMQYNKRCILPQNEVITA